MRGMALFLWHAIPARELIMKTATLIILLLTFGKCSAGEFMQRWPGSRHEWHIVEQTTSADGKALTVVIAVPGGIFPAAMRLEDAKIDKVTLRLQNIRMAEGISFHALKPLPAGQGGDWKDAQLEAGEGNLKNVAGFKNGPDGMDYVLEFTDKALELLRRGGRFQFIDAYRR